MAQPYGLTQYNPMQADQMRTQNRLRRMQAEQAEMQMQNQRKAQNALANLYTEEPVKASVATGMPSQSDDPAKRRRSMVTMQPEMDVQEIQIGTRRKFNRKAARELAAADPEMYDRVMKVRQQQSEAQRDQEAREAAVSATVLQQVDSIQDPELRQQKYENAKRYLQRNGVDVSDWPDQYDPMILRSSLGFASAAGIDIPDMGGGQGEAPTVKTFYDEQGNSYKAQWVNGEWQRVGGSKRDSQSPLAIERKLRLADIDPQSERGQKLIQADLMGQQISMTQGPDGETQVQIGKGVGDSGITSKEETMAGEGRFNAQERLARLQSIKEKFDPEALTYEAGLDRWFSNLREKSTTLKSVLGPLSEREKEKLGQEERLLRRVYNNLNQTLKEMSGAAINAEEANRLKKAIPSPDDGPTRFKNKLEDAIERQRHALMRYNYMLNQEGQFDRENPQFGLDRVPQIVNQAGERIEDEVRARHPDWNDEEVQEAVDRRLEKMFFQTPE